MMSLQPRYLDKAKNPIEGIGRKVFEWIDSSGQAVLIMLEAFYWFPHAHKRRSEVSRQLFTIGLMSFGVVSTVALFTGMILSLQTGQMLRDFGQEANIGIVVSQTMCREMGPFMTALILAASVGSAMAAELGTMRVSEEIDALEVMSINPIRYLVMPRMIAMLIMTPVLTIYSDFIGILGGGLVGYTKLGVSWHSYYRNVLSFLELKEIYVGIFKACIFGIIVATVSCYQGLTTTNGAVGVGRATRKSVVVCFLLVLIVGYFLTSLFYG